MYKADLSFSQLNEYLNSFVGLNLLECKQADRKTVYKTTEKGISNDRRLQCKRQ